MRLEKKLKLILTVTLLFAMIVYHMLGVETPKLITDIFKDFDSTIFTITRITVTVLLLIFTLTNQYVSKVFNWGKFIGGKYKGTIIDPSNTATNNDQINITISQSLLNIKLTGVTFRPNGQRLQTEYVVQGSLANLDSDIYKFIVELEGQQSRYYGLLSLRFEDSIGHGYLYENNPAQTREIQVSFIRTGIKKWLKEKICK